MVDNCASYYRDWIDSVADVWVDSRRVHVMPHGAALFCLRSLNCPPFVTAAVIAPLFHWLRSWCFVKLLLCNHRLFWHVLLPDLCIIKLTLCNIWLSHGSSIFEILHCVYKVWMIYLFVLIRGTGSRNITVFLSPDVFFQAKMLFLPRVPLWTLVKELTLFL